MPKPAITPTGEVAVLAERVYDLLKVDTDFFAWSGTANQAEAEAHLYPYFLSEPEIAPLRDDLPLLVFDAPEENENPDDEVAIAVETKVVLRTTLRFAAYKILPTEAQTSSGYASWYLSNEETALRQILSSLEGQTVDGVRLTHTGVETIQRIAALPATVLFEVPDAGTQPGDRQAYRAVFDVPFGLEAGL